MLPLIDLTFSSAFVIGEILSFSLMSEELKAIISPVTSRLTSLKLGLPTLTEVFLTSNLNSLLYKIRTPLLPS